MDRMYLIKYSEIGVKGNNRHIFEDMLVRNIRNSIKDLKDAYVRKADGRIYITCADSEGEECMDALRKVFGIAGICPVTQYKRRINADGTNMKGQPNLTEEMLQIKRYVVQYVWDTYEDSEFTFKVHCRRADKDFGEGSMDVNMDLGEAILDAFPNAKVDVHEPEVMLTVEIRPYDINIYSEIIPGLGGMPVGSAGKAMLLLSGGIDSPVAGYLMSKRGASVDAIYFHAPPYTSERAKQKVIDLAKIISAYTGPIRMHVVNFTDIQMKIYETCPHDELTIIMRRYMMRIAEHFAIERDCLGLVTGESIGQVASQTMQSLVVTNEPCSLPVYRPLCCFDKLDIVDISQKIGAYETSILPYEDCCTIFVAKHPVTKPRLDKIVKSEKLLEGQIEDLFKQTIDSVEIIDI